MNKRHSDSGMDMGMSSEGGMSAIFVSSTTSALYSEAWTPSSAGAYAGTCIFLILLAFGYRGLFTFKRWLEYKWMAKAVSRRYVVVEGKSPLSERVAQDSDSTRGILSVNGVEESVMVVRSTSAQTQPWRFSIELPRAAIMMVIVGVGYLLMLAVMTMNVGYFMSVLGGSFIGELAFGRFYPVEHH